MEVRENNNRLKMKVKHKINFIYYTTKPETTQNDTLQWIEKLYARIVR